MGTPGHARPDATTEPHIRRDNRRVDLTRPQHDHDANKPHKNLLTRPHSFIHADRRPWCCKTHGAARTASAWVAGESPGRDRATIDSFFVSRARMCDS